MFSLKHCIIGMLATLASPAVAYYGDATFFYVGLGSCGAESSDNDFVMALSFEEAARGAHCWQHAQVTYQGKSIDVTVVDSCQACGKYDIDLSPSAFAALAPLDAGRIGVEWHFYS